MNGRKSEKVRITVKRYSAYIWGIIIGMFMTSYMALDGMTIYIIVFMI